MDSNMADYTQVRFCQWVQPQLYKDNHLKTDRRNATNCVRACCGIDEDSYICRPTPKQQHGHFGTVSHDATNSMDQMLMNMTAKGLPKQNDFFDHLWTPLVPPKLDFSENTAESILEDECDIGYFSFGDRSQCSYSSDKSDILIDSFEDNETQPAISSELDELLDDLVNVVKEMSEKESLTCHICGEIFHSTSARNYHVRSHRLSRVRPHECEYCGKCFSARSALKTHVRKHTGEKPYVCQYCFRSFADKSTQRKHLRIHTGEKPFSCDVCGQKFTQSGNMARHKLTHKKVK